MLKELLADAFKLWATRTAYDRPKEGSPAFDHFRKKLEPAITQIVRDAHARAQNRLVNIIN